MKTCLLVVMLFVLLNLAASVFSSSQLIGSTYLGGSNYETSKRSAMVRDIDGNIFVVSLTYSSDFPYTPGSYSTSLNGVSDICISKFTDDLTTLLASTYYGGAGQEFLYRNTSLAIDNEGNIYVAGQTLGSMDFPYTSDAYDTLYNGDQDVFIAKFTNDLSTLLAATLLGSPGYDEACAIALDSDNNIFVSGYTRSDEFPIIPGAYSDEYAGTGSMPWGGDIFVSKFSNDLTTLIASTYIGGSDWEDGSYMAIDESGNIIIAGSTNSYNFPHTTDLPWGGGTYAGDTYIAKFNNDLSVLIASSFVGGSANDWCYGVCLDQDNNVIITGHTASYNFPVTPDAYDIFYTGGGVDIGDDVFVTILNADLDSIISSTFLGANGWEGGNSVIIDDSGYIYVGGNTNSSNFIFIPGAFDTTFNGGGLQYAGDAFVAKLNSDVTQLISFSYLGGGGQEAVTTMILDDSGNLFVSGFTNSSNFPTDDYAMNSCYPDYFGGGIDAYGGDVFITAFPIEQFIDSDIDGVLDFGDNCPFDYNPSQADYNGNGIGNACDTLCGDADVSGAINILDITYLISYLYKGGPVPLCLWAADPDGNVAINILDITYLISFLYKDGPEPVCSRK